MSEPITEIIHCHGCPTTKLRVLRDPTTGATKLLQNDLKQWKWILLQHHCYCTNCSSQALADSLDDLWNYFHGLPKADNS